MGLSGALPYILTNRITYKEQAFFSLVSLPFSFKLLWAPLVDGIYSKKYGRRKTWLIPVQFICGIVMLLGAEYVEIWIGNETNTHPNVTYLTFYFILLYFLMATQDIAVDGWALTMLSDENISFASTCNSIGQTLGYFLAQVGFLLLNDVDVCNSYFRDEPKEYPLLTLGQFLFIWGIIILITTILIALFKKEKKNINNNNNNSNDENQIKLYYKHLLSCIKHKPLHKVIFFLITYHIPYAITDSATALKLIEKGMPKEDIAFLTPWLISFGIFIPIFMAKYMHTKYPLNYFIKSVPYRIIAGIIYGFCVYIADYIFQSEEGKQYMMLFWSILIIGITIHDTVANVMFVAQIGFFAKISDPLIGGTYMTLLNTFANLGSKWPKSLSLYLLDYTTIYKCNDIFTYDKENNDNCNIYIDGYFIQLIICLFFGIIWLIFMPNYINNFQSYSTETWYLPKKNI